MSEQKKNTQTKYNNTLVKPIKISMEYINIPQLK